MNKLFLIAILLLFVINIIGCSKSEAYTSEEAINRGDIINLYGNGVQNLDKFLEFLKNVSKKEEDAIRITSYTEEGDPIFKDLKFNGKVIHYRYDDSNDGFAGNDKGVKNVTCSEINIEEPKGSVVYYFIRGCSEEKIDSFLISVNKYELKQSTNN